MIATAMMALATAAQAPVSDHQLQTLLFLELVSRRAPQCDLIEAWEGAAVRTQTAQVLRGFDIATQDAFEAQIQDRMAEVACDDEQMNAWVEAFRPGISREFLPPILALYRGFARQDDPPALFLAEADAGRAEAIARIDARLAQWQAAGITPEGGGDWAGYATRVEAAADRIRDVLASGEADGLTPAQASMLIRDSVTVTELWLAAADG